MGTNFVMVECERVLLKGVINLSVRRKTEIVQFHILFVTDPETEIVREHWPRTQS